MATGSGRRGGTARVGQGTAHGRGPAGRARQPLAGCGCLSSMRPYALLFFVLFCTCVRAPLHAQRVLLFERLTSSKSDRVYEGEMLRFRLEGDNFWQQGHIREMRPDIQALVINDRFIMLDNIETVHRGSTAFARVGAGLMTFGVGWSLWAGLGYATDGDPTTRYSSRDLTTSLTALGSGFLIYKLFGQRKYRTGRYKRLRVVDTTF